jgi:poly(A) polymerase
VRTLEDVRRVLAGADAWIVGGAVRDALLGRAVTDADVALAGDVRRAARRVARETGGAPFPLSDAFGAWRVVARDHSWQIDLVPLQGDSIESDLALRDFTINAMAEHVAGGPRIDPHGGAGDLAARCVRMVSEPALEADPLRTLRAARIAAELGFEVEPATVAAVRAHAGGLAQVAGERVFGELKRLVGGEDPVRGLRLMAELSVADAVLPELTALGGVEQNIFHHLDVLDHTLAVLDAAVALARDPAAAGLGRHEGAIRELLARPLADDLDRAGGLRWAALLHDIAKPETRGERPDGRVTFIGHDQRGAEVAAAILRRLRASERLANYVAALTRNHLSIGFLVHERPLDRRTAWRFLRATRPYSADVVLLTVADRLATRGRNAEPAIAAHLEVADAMLGHAFADSQRPPLVRGDDLARALGRTPGPWLGELLARIEEDRYAGELSTPEEAVERARSLLGEEPRT